MCCFESAITKKSSRWAAPACQGRSGTRPVPPVISKVARLQMAAEVDGIQALAGGLLHQGIGVELAGLLPDPAGEPAEDGTESILASLGYSGERIAALRREGAV